MTLPWASPVLHGTAMTLPWARMATPDTCVRWHYHDGEETHGISWAFMGFRELPRALTTLPHT